MGAEMYMKARIIVADDDASMRSVLRFNLVEDGHDVTVVADGAEAFACLEGANPAYDLVISDVKMPNLTGLELLRSMHEGGIDTDVILVTAFGSVEDAVLALEAGAVDYMTKPFRRAELKTRVVRALEQRRLRQENQRLQAQVQKFGDSLVTVSNKMHQLLSIVDRIAPSDVTVLITGESGTGKELVARRLHEQSGRRAAPFVPLNCAALPRDLLETELFGHEKGAFTGAHRSHRGKFEAAHKGTLFLDEIGELPLELQSKLLRVLEEGVVDRIGSETRHEVNVRIVAATNRELRTEVASGRFRGDLFHRLNVVAVLVPPLSERPEDIEVLAHHFLRQFGGEDLALAPALVDALRRRPWPGNVRELKNMMERMVLLRRGQVLDLADLVEPGMRVQTPAAPSTVQSQYVADTRNLLTPGKIELPDEGFDLVALEQEIVRKALAKHQGNQSATARYLGIPRHVLIYRLGRGGS